MTNFSRAARRPWSLLLPFFMLSVTLALGTACSRQTPDAVEPVELDAAVEPQPDVIAPPADVVVQPGADTTGTVPALGGLWVVDAQGQPVGVLVQRGHPSVSTGGQVDLLRDGAVVYSPKAGVFFGLQMSTGQVIAPRLGVSDSACDQPLVAGYYTDEAFVSGFGYAFVYRNAWYQVQGGQPVQLVSCAGTVADGVGAKCAPHSGSCRGFPVDAWGNKPAPPTSFPAPLGFSWLSGN
jgi:hypothetical protein